MGTSTNAIIAFGFQLGEEGETPPFLQSEEDEEFDFDEIRARELGVTEKYPTREQLAAHPADLVWHCSSDYPMYFLAVNGTQVEAYGGCPKSFKLPEISEEQIAALKAWCEKNGVEWQEPAWHLMSYWG